MAPVMGMGSAPCRKPALVWTVTWSPGCMSHPHQMPSSQPSDLVTPVAPPLGFPVPLVTVYCTVTPGPNQPSTESQSMLARAKGPQPNGVGPIPIAVVHTDFRLVARPDVGQPGEVDQERTGRIGGYAEGGRPGAHPNLHLPLAGPVPVTGSVAAFTLAAVTATVIVWLQPGRANSTRLRGDVNGRAAIVGELGGRRSDSRRSSPAWVTPFTVPAPASG